MAWSVYLSKIQEPASDAELHPGATIDVLEIREWLETLAV
jgi:hypothetical protein